MDFQTWKKVNHSKLCQEFIEIIRLMDPHMDPSFFGSGSRSSQKALDPQIHFRIWIWNTGAFTENTPLSKHCVGAPFLGKISKFQTGAFFNQKCQHWNVFKLDIFGATGKLRTVLEHWESKNKNYFDIIINKKLKIQRNKLCSI